jgi:PKD domain
VAVLAAIVALIVVSSADAAPSWLPTVGPSPPITPAIYPVALAREGGCSSIVLARGGTIATTRPAGGSFAIPAQNLGTSGSGYPEAAAAGAVAAIDWLDAGAKLRVADATGCGPFGAAAEVPSTPASPDHARVAVDSSGTTIAVVGGGSTGSRRAYVSERPQGGAPSAATALPLASGEGFRPWVATSAQGGAGIVFDVVDSGNQLYGSLRTASGWSTPVRLNEEGKAIVADSARVAIGPDGILRATWIENATGKLILGSLAPGGSLDRVTFREVSGGSVVSEPGAFPKIVEDDSGRIGVIWVEQTAGGRTVKARVAEPGGSFTGVLDVSPTTNHIRSFPWLAIDRFGRFVAAYSDSPSIGHVDAWGATLEPGASTFTEPVSFGEATHLTQPNGISTDDQGNTLVSIYKSDGTTEARVAVFDAAAPVINGLSVPGSGTVGQALAFSVSPVDAWSPLGATAWNFGDGGIATGNTASHAFSAPGSPQITVSAGDSLGNSSEASGSVAVSAGEGEGAPSLTDLKLSRRRFRAAGGGSAKAAVVSKRAKKVPVGTMVSFRLSEAASVRLYIGPRRMKKLGHIPKGFSAYGNFSRSAKAGANTFRFSGKLGGRRLISTQYRLQAIATDSDGKKSRPQSVTFTVVGH